MRYAIGAIFGAILSIMITAGAATWKGALTGIVGTSGNQFGIANPFPVLPPPVTPMAGSPFTVAVGGTPVTMVTGPVNGCQINNSPLAADENIPNVEFGYVNPVVAAGLGGYGTTQPVQPGQYWSCPGPLPSGVNVSVNAATSGHRFSVTIW